MTAPLRIFVGYDSREPAAYAVCCHSIVRHARRPVSIAPVALPHLAGLYTRERSATESTEFSLTRFLVPYLAGYEGLVVFMDCDILLRADIHEVLDRVAADPGRAVWACKHDYTPRAAKKFLGQLQVKYERKNWSSFVVFDAARCRALTPHMVSTLTGLELHRFLWLRDDEVGSLPLAWNHLVGEESQERPPKAIHFSDGGPWFKGYEDVEFADEWRAERALMLGEGAPRASP